MEGEDRHLDGEGQAERSEEPELLLQAQGSIQQVRVGEGPHACDRPGRKVEVEEGHQHQERAERREEEELHRGVDPPLPPPHPDDEIHGDEGDLPEYVEEEEIHGEKHPHHPGLHEEHEGVEGLLMLLDVVEGAQDGDGGGEGGEHHHEEADPVQRHRIAHPPACDPGDRGGELEAAHARARKPTRGPGSGPGGTSSTRRRCVSPGTRGPASTAAMPTRGSQRRTWRIQSPYPMESRNADIRIFALRL